MSVSIITSLIRRRRRWQRTLAFSARVLLLCAYLFAQLPLSALLLQRSGSAAVPVAYADTADAWFDPAYAYRTEITIDHTRVSNTDQHDFPVLISLVDANLKSVASGGKVASASGYDFLCADSAGTGRLSHEIESYDAATGNIVLWVKIPELSASLDTSFYLYYGNAAIGASQEDPAGVWSNDFKLVQHLGQDPAGAPAQMKDSTSYANDGTAVGSMTSGNSIVGPMARALNFDGSDDYLSRSDRASLDFTTDFTLGMWVNSRFLAADVFGLAGKTCSGGGAQDHHYMLSTNGPLLQFTVGSGDCANESSSNDSLSKTGFFSGFENKWVFVTATYSRGAMKLYRNGVAQASKTSALTSLKSASDGFNAGRYPNYNGFYLNGSLDELRASAVARSADWIATEYNNQVNPGGFSFRGEEEMYRPAPLTDWGFRKTITIDHTRVAGDLSDFPVLIDLPSDTGLATHARSDGGDLLFTLGTGGWEDGDQDDRLSHEIESYTAATGSLQAWVKVPQLSASTDTVLYLYYGNAAAVNQQNRTTVWDRNTRMVQHMDADPAAAAPVLLDSGGYANHGSAAGGMTGSNIVSGKFGRAITFDGSDDSFSVTSNPSLNLTSEVTLEGWMKSSDTWNGRSVLGKGNAYVLYCNYPNQLKSYVYSGGWKASTSIAGLFGTNRWYHYVMTYAPAVGAVKVYLNGQEVSYLVQDAVSGSIATNSNPVQIGQGLGGNPFSGVLDEVRISSVARSAAWIATEYNSGSSPSDFYALGIEQVRSGTALSSWRYRKAVIIDHNQVTGPGELQDFPVLVSLSADADLGRSAQADGADILFAPASLSWSSGTENDRLSHELVSYDPLTGQLQAWVKVPQLSSQVDTVLYLYYGNAASAEQQNRSDTWRESGSSNYRLVQHLEEDPSGSAPQIKDATSYRSDATAQGAMTSANSVTGQVGRAANFDALDDYLEVSGGSSFNQLPLTLEAWVKTSGSGTNRGIINKYASASNNGYQLYINGGRIKAWYFNGTGNYTRQDLDADDGGLVNDGLWHQVVYRVDFSGGSIFVDGTLKNTKAWTGSAGSATTSQPLRIGQYTAYFNGAVDEVRLSAGNRSAEWIATEYRNQSGPGAFLALSGEQSYLDRLSLTGPATGAAGAAQTVTLTAQGAGGDTFIDYTGDRSVTFSGASSMGIHPPTFTDQSGREIEFGRSGTLSFVAGVAHTDLRLYRAETAEIEATDGTVGTLATDAYDLELAVTPAAFHTFEVAVPDHVRSETSFTLSLSPQDAYGNAAGVTEDAFLSVDYGVIDVTSLPPAVFASGAYAGPVTLSEIGRDQPVVLTIAHGSLSQTVGLTVQGVSHGGFVPPAKPNLSSLVVTFADDGRLLLDHLPAGIIQIALSTSSDFSGASWWELSRRDEALRHLGATSRLYLKFRTGAGAVSDVVSCERSSSSSSTSDLPHLGDGAIVKTAASPDVYILKFQGGKRYRRLILNPEVFNSYGHLRWENLRLLSTSELGGYVLSDLVRAAGDEVVYRLFPAGDTGARRPLDLARPYDADSVYEINGVDRDNYQLAQ